MKINDLTGKTFGRLYVERRVNSIVESCGKKEGQYLCTCECGKQVVVRARNLIYENTKSCGCGRGNRKNEWCVYMPNAVECYDQTLCEICGWNPENKELIEKRLEKIKERMRENDRIKSYTANENSSVL